MILLLDTHTLLWFLRDDPLLSIAAKSFIEDSQNRKLVSVASCWEISIKVGLRKLDLAETSRTLLERELPKNNFELLPISLGHATAVETLPQHHKDPFDRLLIAQSIIEDIPLVSVDEKFDAYPVTRLW